MPESYFQLSAKDQADALNAASAASGRPPHLLEKDIWVLWSLATLFQSEFGPHLVFKGGTALSKAYKVIRRFSEDVDLTYDIRALAPELVGKAADGIDAIPPSRSQEKKWSDEIRRELLPAWLRDHAHPVVQAELTTLATGTCRVTEDCIFIDYTPVTPASSYSLPRVKLEFGARSSGEPSTVITVRSDIEGLIAGVEFPVASPRVMNLTRIFWEKATAAHVYCLQGEKGLSERFSRHFHDLARLEEAGHLAEALAAQDVAHAVAIHKSAFFAEKDTDGNRIDYMEAVRAGLTLLPSGNGYDALRHDYQRMIEDGLLFEDAEPFELLMTKCSGIQAQLKRRM
jgi:Nucleotidyl transferase AbiEii toxin, Type IV TA system